MPFVRGLDIAARDTTLVSMVKAIAFETPDAEFLVETRTSSLTYSHFYKLTTRLIPIHLLQLFPNSFQSGAKVAIISPNNPLVPLVSWTLWHIGVTTVPLSMSAEPKLWLSMLETARVELVLASHLAKDRLSSAFDLNPSVKKPAIVLMDAVIPSQYVGSTVIERSHQWLSDASAPVQEVARSRIDSTSAAVLLFTSSAIDASTLKCVTYSHASMLHAGWRAVQGAICGAFTLSPKRHLGWLPLSHCFELTASLCGFVLCTGGTYIFHNSAVSSPSAPASTTLSLQILEALQFHRPIDSICSVPSVLESLPSPLPATYMDSLRALKTLVVGGAPTPPHIWSWAAGSGLNYIDMAGATEVAGAMCYRKSSEATQGTLILPGLMGILEKINEADGFGELIILGEHLPHRYENIENSAFCYDPRSGITSFRTGDVFAYVGSSPLAFVRGQEFPTYSTLTPGLEGLQYLGRVDDIIVLASGLKANALALEQQLDSQPEILKSAVVPSTDGTELVALIVPSTAFRTLPETVTNVVLRMNQDLPYEKRFKRDNIVIADELPLTTKATLHRKLLKHLLSENGGIWPSLRSSSIGEVDEVPTDSSETTTMDRTEPELTMTVRAQVARLLSDTLSIPLTVAQDPEVKFADLQISSLATVQFASALSRAFSLSITAAQLYGLMNLDELSAWVVTTKQTDSHRGPSQPDAFVSPKEAPVVGVSGRLAITGAVCQFPGGVDTLSKFWEALLSPHSPPDFVRPPPPSRWATKPGEDIHLMGWLDSLVFTDLNSFSTFFGVAPSEVEGWTPNARLCLQMGYRALEDAGIRPRSVSNRKWGVFTSVNDSGWRERRVQELGMNEYGKSWMGTADDAVGARLAYFLNLTGPCVEIKTACSSSAVATHQACAAIRNGDCEAALIVSSTTFFSPASSIGRRAAGIVSKQGRCATFSEDADGYLPSEGTAAIVIQRPSDIQIEPYGYIKATMVAQNGRSRGFGAPNPHSQAQLIEDALARAGYAPRDISYLETHGTGTRLGDVIEINAINQVFGSKRTSPLAIGAVKAVIGHTEECAGLAGILKSLLCLRHDMIPPQPGLKRPNPELNLGAAQIVIPRRPLAFTHIRGDNSRIIGVSSFGFSGTLAHLILEKEQQYHHTSQEQSSGAMVLTAKSPADLKCLARSFLDFTESPDAGTTNLMDACKTMQVGRDHFSYRIAWPVNTWRRLGERLRDALLDNTFDSVRPSKKQGPDVVLWFALPHDYQSFPPEHLVHPSYVTMLAEYPQKGCTPELEYFAGQLAYVRLLKTMGCHISAVGGEGVCELVAATVAGLMDDVTLFSLLSSMVPFEDGRTTCSVKCGENEMWKVLCGFDAQQLRVSAQYGMGAYHLSGTGTAIAFLKDALSASYKVLENHPILSHRLPLDASMLLLPACYPVVSGHLGGVIDSDAAMSPQYWRTVMTRSWDSHAACQELARLGDVVVNIGSNFFLPEVDTDTPVIDSLSGLEDITCRLFEMGVDVPWNVFGAWSDRLLVHLPTYCWA